MAIKGAVKFNKTDGRAKEIGRLGGLANKNNPNTILAAKLRWMRTNKEILPKDEEMILELFTHPDLNLLDRYKALVKLAGIIEEKEKETSKKDIFNRLELFDRHMAIHKALYGDKIKQDINANIQTTGINININIPLEVKDLMKNAK